MRKSTKEKELMKLIDKMLEVAGGEVAFVVINGKNMKNVMAISTGECGLGVVKDLLKGVEILAEDIADDASSKIDEWKNDEEDDDVEDEVEEDDDDDERKSESLNDAAAFVKSWEKLEAALKERGYFDKNGKATDDLDFAMAVDRMAGHGSSHEDFIKLLNRLSGYVLSESEVDRMANKVEKTTKGLINMLKGIL